MSHVSFAFAKQHLLKKENTSPTSCTRWLAGILYASLGACMSLELNDQCNQCNCLLAINNGKIPAIDMQVPWLRVSFLPGAQVQCQHSACAPCHSVARPEARGTCPAAISSAASTCRKRCPILTLTSNIGRKGQVM